MKLSLVVPCYNEESNVRLFHDAAANVFDNEGYDYEMVFVNDGSRRYSLLPFSGKCRQYNKPQKG